MWVSMAHNRYGVGHGKGKSRLRMQRRGKLEAATESGEPSTIGLNEAII